MVHNLLPTQERLIRFRLASQEMGLCTLCRLDVEDNVHAFFLCPNNNVAGLCVLGWIQVLVPNLSQEDAIKVDLGDSMTGDEEVAVLQVLAISLKYIWEARLSKKMVTVHQIRSEIEANITILRKASKISYGSHDQ